MKQFAKPSVGSSIAVTTRYKETYYYSKDKWRDTTHTGIVLPSEPWLKADEFSMTSGEPLIKSRTINLKNVINLTIDGETADQRIVNDTKVVRVAGSKGKEYFVTIKDGSPISCTCQGFHYRNHCRHLKEAMG